MRKVFFLSVLILTLISCQSQNILKESLIGTYSNIGADYEYTLVLNADSTSSFSHKVQDANPRCAGNWKYEEVDGKIVLLCNEVKNIFETLSSGYLQERKNTLEVLSANELKYNNLILKKI